MAATVGEARQVLEQQRVDFLFLNIDPGMETGFDMLKSIPAEEYAVIFTSAHQDYSLQALKANALDYLLKPLDLGELDAAVSKARNFINRKTVGLTLGLPGIATAQQAHQERDDLKLVIRHERGFEVLQARHIIVAEADGNYTTFYLEDKRKTIASKQLGLYEELLAAPLFFRCHKSYIINLDHLQGYSSTHGHTAVMAGSHEAPISRRKLPEFLELFRNRMG